MTQSNENASERRQRPSRWMNPWRVRHLTLSQIPPNTLRDQVLERTNLQRALKHVRQNKGAPGIEGMTVDELAEYLKPPWLDIRAQLEAGRYRSQPVKRVALPKGNGKSRPLGIPTGLDRFI